MQNIRKILRVNFSKFLILDPFGPKIPEQDFFKKVRFCHFFNLDDKLSYGQTDKRKEGFSLFWYSVLQKGCGFSSKMSEMPCLSKFITLKFFK